MQQNALQITVSQLFTVTRDLLPPNINHAKLVIGGSPTPKHGLYHFRVPSNKPGVVLCTVVLPFVLSLPW